MTRLLLSLALGLGCLAATAGLQRERLSLDGRWGFELDPGDRGAAEGWHDGRRALSHRITVPGAWEAQGFGTAHQLPHVRHVYTGAAWYLRRVDLPLRWSGRRIWLCVGGSHRIADAWVNGVPVGTHDGFTTGYRFEVTHAAQPGRENRVVFRVSNAAQPGNAMRGCFNYFHPLGGFSGTVHLETTPATYLDDVAIRTAPGGGHAVFEVRAAGDPLLPGTTLLVRGRSAEDGGGFQQTARLGADLAALPAMEVPIPSPRHWSPQAPHLYQATVQLSRGAEVLDEVQTQFGLRQAEARGGAFWLNGKPLLIRGVGEDAVSPLRGFPPFRKSEYVARFRQLRALGFNAVRFHSWCPPPAAFEAADEVGLLLQPELPIVYRPYRDPNREVLLREWRRLILQNRNHPSLFSLGMGNEMYDTTTAPIYDELSAVVRALAPHVLVMDTSGWDYDVPGRRTDIYTGGQGPLLCRPPRSYPQLPAISHELGNFNALEDFADRRRYRGVALPAGIDRAREAVAQASLLPRYGAWLAASRGLQRDAWKWIVEEARSQPQLDGYHFWMATDFPETDGGDRAGVTDANVGLCNAFWELKPHVRPAEFLRFNGDVVLLARLASPNLRSDARVTVPVLVSNFGGEPLRGGRLVWRLDLGGRTVRRGVQPAPNLADGSLSPAGSIDIAPPAVDQPCRGRLSVSLQTRARSVGNEWPVWVFPGQCHVPPDLAIRLVGSGLDGLREVLPGAVLSQRPAGEVSVVTEWSSLVVDYLEAGGRVISLGGLPGARTESCRGFASAFLPGWWNLRNNFGVTIGAHPLFDALGHPGYCDFGFRMLLELSGARLDLGPLDPRLEPILWAVPSRKGYLFEIAVGRGRVLATSLDLVAGVRHGDPWSAFLLSRMATHLASAGLPGAQRLAPERLRAALAASVSPAAPARQ